MVNLQGLITGRTTAFLLDPASADIHSKQNIATTQSHEVAHMWQVFLRLVRGVMGDNLFAGSATSQRWSGGITCI